MDAPPTVTRARPRQAPAVDSALVRTILQQHERNHWTKVYLSLIVGLLLLPLGPLLINTVLWLYYQEFSVVYRWKFQKAFLFWPHFWIVALISLPILFLLASLVNRNLMDAFAESSDESFRRGFVMRRAMVLLLLAEIGNIGPRLIILAVRRTRARRALGQVDLNRLAVAVAQLAAADESIPPQQLLCPDESPHCLEQILPLLLFYDIIDLSKKADRLWLASPIKRRLGLQP